MYSSKSTLPLDVIHEVIGHLRDDKNALGACSLVCQAWLPFARYHLFGEIYLCGPGNSTSITQLLELLEDGKCNWIVPFVRHVTVMDAYGDHSVEVHGLLSCLTAFAPALISIDLTRLQLSYDQLHGCLPLHQLTKMELFHCSFGAHHDFSTLLSNLPLLETLLLSLFWLGGEPPTRTVQLPSLRHLEVNQSCNALTFIEPTSMLRKLEVAMHNEDMSPLGVFLSNVRPHIEDFHISGDPLGSIQSLITHLDLRSMSHLRNLFIEFIRKFISVAAHIPSVLDQITSPEIECIRFVLLDATPIRRDIWTAIPAILRRPNFTQLRKLHFRLEGTEDMGVMDRWIHRQLREVEDVGVNGLIAKLVVTGKED